MGEDYITFTQINDFLFSPASLYLHSAYESYSDSLYKEKAQVAGTIAHETIERGTYSTHRAILMGTVVYSEKYNILGKIDVFNTETGVLVERKNRVSRIYFGQVCQVWGQYFALTEMGYTVHNIFIHSLSDNKRYEIQTPDAEGERRFAEVLRAMREFDPVSLTRSGVDAKGARSIYGVISW